MICLLLQMAALSYPRTATLGVPERREDQERTTSLEVAFVE